MFCSLRRMSEVLKNLNRKTDCLSVVDSGLAAAFSLLSSPPPTLPIPQPPPREMQSTHHSVELDSLLGFAYTLLFNSSGCGYLPTLLVDKECV